MRALAKAGWRIKVAVPPSQSGFFLRPLGQVGQIDFVKCDVTDPEQVAAGAAGRRRRSINLTGILFAERPDL